MLDKLINAKTQGERLKEARQLTKLSRRAFALKHGLNLSAYHAWENGRYKKGISIKNAKLIVEALASENIFCHLEWLLHGNGERPYHQKPTFNLKNVNNIDQIINQVRHNEKIKKLNNQLIIAIKNNDLVTCQKLINTGANLHRLIKEDLYLYSQKENTPLHIAAMYSGSLLIDYFIKLGLNPNIRNRYNETPLHYAAYEENINAMQTLIKQNASLEATSQKGTPPLMWAAVNGRTESIKLLIKSGAQINYIDFIGSTALHWAAFNNHANTIQILSENGCDTCIKNFAGLTAFDIALKNGHIEAVKALLSLS